jgi:hypothetical protein
MNSEVSKDLIYSDHLRDTIAQFNWEGVPENVNKYVLRNFMQKPSLGVCFHGHSDYDAHNQGFSYSVKWRGPPTPICGNQTKNQGPRDKHCR